MNLVEFFAVQNPPSFPRHDVQNQSIFASPIGQEWLLDAFDGLVDFTVFRMSVQKIMLGDEDEVEEDADISEPQFDWIPNHSAPVRLKAGINK